MGNLSDDDGIVISGIDGKFPKSQNMEEFKWHLYNNMDMSTCEEQRWKHSDFPTLPKRAYFIDGLEKFDATLFKVSPKQAEVMDSQCRILLELTYSAILDAGIHPATLRGSRTGVFTATSYNDSMSGSFEDSNARPDGYKFLGSHGVFLANRISFALDLRGPSCVIDAACTSTLYAILMAVNSMRLDQCDAALICGTNVQFNPNLTLHMSKIGVLSEDGISWSFDSKGNGYSRSDSIVAMFLQKRKDAKRIYAEVVHILGNNDGYKLEGINCPSGIEQSEVFSRVYKDVKIDPLEVKYVETHMTGTPKGDPEECLAIDMTFNQERKEPLLVGALKPNMGHSEGASGLCSIAKVLLAFQTDVIPATIHVVNLRQDIPSLTEGRLKVCTENTPLPGPLVALNSFGYGGSNAHLLLKQWNKVKDHKKGDPLPRLVVWSGRTKESVSTVINRVKSTPLDLEFIGLLHQIQKTQISENSFRGFGVFEDKGVDQVPLCLSEKTAQLENYQRPVVWLFTGMGCQWIGMGKSLLQIQPFHETILKCHNILKKFDVDLISVITTYDKNIYDKILNSFVGITCIQIALVDVLRLLEIPVDFIIGHSNGELAASYADGAVTFEQAVLTAYYKGKLSIDTDLIDGLMAAVGLGYNQIKYRLPPRVYVGCHNTANSCTITGPREDVLQFIEKLKSAGIFAREVNTSRIAYHSEYVVELVQKLVNHFRCVMPERTLRSSKWISTSVPSHQWNSDFGRYNSAEYHAKNLTNPVLFEEACEHLPKNAIIIEVGPHGLMQSIMRRTFPKAINIPLTQRDNPTNVAFFMEALGKLFTHGVGMHVDRLYPQIEFPVSRGTPMISPLIKYDHEKNWVVPNLSAIKKNSLARKVTIDISQEEYQYLTGHIIDDRCILPISTYCYLVWETLALQSSEPDISNFNVELTNVRCYRQTPLLPGVPVHLSILIHTSGDFEVTEDREPLITGSIKHNSNSLPTLKLPTEQNSENSLILNLSEIYREMQLRGYQHSKMFAGLNSFCVDNSSAEIQWIGYWDLFLDSMTHLFFMSRNTRTLNLILSIGKIIINATEHLKLAENSKTKSCQAKYYKETNTIVGGGIEISGLESMAFERRNPTDTEVIENYQFVPFKNDTNLYTLTNAVRICLQLSIEKLLPYQLTVLEVLNDQNDPIIEHFRDVLSLTPLVSGSFKLITDRNLQMDSIEIKHPSAIDQSKNTIVILNGVHNSTTKIISRQGVLIVMKIHQDSSNFDPPEDFTLLSVVPCVNFSFLIFHQVPDISECKVISITSLDHEYSWLKKIQDLKKTEDVILLSEYDKSSGLLGLFKALRAEPNTPNFKCVIVDDDDAPPFDMHHHFYSSQLKLGFPVNVLQNGKWGTYRQLSLKVNEIVPKSYNSLCIQAKHFGNLQSLEWAPCISSGDNEKIQVQYAGLSQSDVMLATGQCIRSSYFEGNVKQTNVFGGDFSGFDANGRQVMGLKLEDGTLATEISCSPNDFIFSVPPSMTLEEAASIPMAYLTTYSAFFIGNDISAGRTILICNGYNYMGLAAIQIGLTYGLNVYTVVSCSKEKDFLLERYSALKDNNIDISPNFSFERARVEHFKFDVIWSFQPEDQIEGIIQCLNEGGMLVAVEPSNVGKIMKCAEPFFKLGIVVKTIYLDKLTKNLRIRKRLIEMINADLHRGVIRHLPSITFQSTEIEHAFRSISTEKHAKILVSMPKQSEIAKIKVKPIFVANPKSVYVIPGGLGDLGLELSNWLIMRGAKIIVLSSRQGLSSPYQRYRVSFWTSLGCKIVVSKLDVSTFAGCKRLLEESGSYGPVAGIFNLAVDLFDAILENQTPDRFRQCLAPKADGTKYLDELSRELCPHLEHFVVFSSVASGRGSPGQSNYAMGNSIADRIIENRVQQNLPGKSIQWGPFSGGGIISRLTNNNTTEIYRGMSQQRMDRCYHYLDDILFARSAIVSCIQVPHKDAVEEVNVFTRVLQVFGIKDMKQIRSSATLADLGLDSLIASEIKQMLEKEANAVLSMSDVKAITVERLKIICQ